MSVQRMAVLCAVLLIALITGCSKESSKQIDLTKTETIQHAVKDKASVVRIAVGGMITPKEGLYYYRDFLDFIGNEIGKPVEYVDIQSYEEINNMLERQDIDAAFVCSGPYVDGHQKFGLELLAAPQAYGGTVYYSYFIAPKNSGTKSLNDLKGKLFAFTDPLSNSGKLVPEYILARRGESSGTFFSKTVYSGSHDKSIQAVADELVDGAAVDSLIWEYLNKIKPELTRKTRIFMKSDPYAIPPFVVHPALDPKLKERLRTVLLTAHTHPKGKALLDKMMIERFVTIEDKAFDSIRNMKSMVDVQKNGK